MEQFAGLQELFLIDPFEILDDLSWEEVSFHTVSDLSYAGDQGGIVCHIVPPEKQEVLVVSLTQLHVPRATCHVPRATCHAACCSHCRLSEASGEKTQEARTALGPVLS